VYRNVSLASHWISNSWKVYWGRWLLRSVDVVASVGPISAADFSSTYQFPQSRICTIRRGIEMPSHLNPAESRRKLCQIVGRQIDDPLLFHVGGLTAEKNHRGLLQAFRVVQRQFPHSHLVLCGEGPLREQIEQQYLHLGLQGRVHLLGNRPDVRELLSAAALLLLPSDVEGVPGVVLEAAACGVPAVCTCVGGVPDAIVDGVTGVLISPGDMAGFGNAVCRLLADQPLRMAIAAAAREFVVQHHDMSRCVEQFEALYQDVLGYSLSMARTSEAVGGWRGTY
jgi:glycosyltransferase involved in cell wall biosynthesis